MPQASGSTAGSIAASNSASADGRSIPLWEMCLQSIGTPWRLPTQVGWAYPVELRAAMSLSRLWQGQGKRAAARELVSEIYGWFIEGFDTTILQEAKALAAALSS